MADSAVHDVPSIYEPSLFARTQENRNVAVPALRLLTFGALLTQQLRGEFRWGRLAPAVPFGEYAQCHNYDGVSLDQFPDDGAGGRASVHGDAKINACGCWRPCFCGTGFIVLHGREWTKIIAEGLTLSMFPLCRQRGGQRIAQRLQGRPNSRSTFFTLTGDAHAARDAKA